MRKANGLLESKLLVARIASLPTSIQLPLTFWSRVLVGQLNYPKYPDIPGLKDFQKKTMHSARWDWTYDIRGKKVIVIGNGSLIP